MMARATDQQIRFHMVTIESFISEEHFVRRVAQLADFSFIYREMEDCYCHNNGQPSIDPVVLIKYLLPVFLYGSESERRIGQELQANTAYRWFPGLDPDERFQSGRPKNICSKGADCLFVCGIIRVSLYGTADQYFSATEMFSPIMSDTMTSNIFVIALENLIVSLADVSAIELLALRIGFIKKSVSVTLIGAFILAGLYGNIVIGSAGNMAVSLLITGIFPIAILAVSITLSHKIDHMEIE